MALISLPRVFKYDSIRIGLRIPNLIKVQTASIVSKELRDPNVKKPDPWPYQTKKFTFLRGYFEGTLKRFDENTKIIVVDGNIGAGKSSFAKQLAEAFDMYYIPEPDLEDLYITAYGYDLRLIDELMPPSYKCCDLKVFYSNPHHQNVAKFQFHMYMRRLNQYLDALAHVLNTGQGVVLERCVYGDYVFLETMYKFGYIGSAVRDLYYDINKNTLEELLRPHLVIYLDITPEVALDRIKKRNDPIEVNSKVLTKEYLGTIEHFYKQDYLRKMEEHAELLIYDWSNYGDVEVVVEDVERIDFDKYSIYDQKLKDWRLDDDWEWNERRRYYTNHKGKIMGYAEIFRPSVTEVHHPGEDVEAYSYLIEKIPGEQFCDGFNRSAGDNIWFKDKHKSYRHIPVIRTQRELL